MRIEWADGVIANRWLQVRVLANANTGLPSQQTFYIGHLQGEVNGLAVGGTSGTLQVTNADIGVVRPLIGTNATVTSVADITKNGLVQNSDITAIRSGVGLRQLRLITIPIAGSGGEGTGNSGGSGGGGGDNGDNNQDLSDGVSDESLVDGFAMMAPSAETGTKFDKTEGTKPSDPPVDVVLSRSPTWAGNIYLLASWNPTRPNASNEEVADGASRITSRIESIEVRLKDDFFASLGDRENT